MKFFLEFAFSFKSLFGFVFVFPLIDDKFIQQTKHISDLIVAEFHLQLFVFSDNFQLLWVDSVADEFRGLFGHLLRDYLFFLFVESADQGEGGFINFDESFMRDIVNIFIDVDFLNFDVEGSFLSL